MGEEIIDPRTLLVRVAQILDKLKISYVVTGGMAIYVWGRPRFTSDVDIVIKLEATDIGVLVEELKSLSEINYIDNKSIKRALEKRGEFNFIDGVTGVKVDFWIFGEDEFSKDQLRHRVSKDVLGHKVFFVSPEDLILSKLIWHKKSESSRQYEDVESILKIQKKLDMKYIKKWAKVHSTDKILEKLLKGVR